MDLLDEGVFQAYLRDPRLFRQEMRRHKRDTWVIVDEVQRLPPLLNEVHRAIEDLRLRFVLLGSSARKLRMAGTNLLGGRALRREMHPPAGRNGSGLRSRRGPAIRQRTAHLAPRRLSCGRQRLDS